jgi:hypothetical protein
MSVFQSDKQKHLQMVYKNNVVIAKDEDRIIVVHSKRTTKPLLPFEITQKVFEQWSQRDSRIAFTDTPFKELFTPIAIARNGMVCVTDFNELEFIEH